MEIRKMYEETGCFDPNSIPEDGPNSFEQNLKLSMEELSYHQQNNNNSSSHPAQDEDASASASAAAIDVQLQDQLAFNAQLMQETENQELYTQSNWNPNAVQEIQDINFDQIQNTSLPPEPPYPPPTPDLLNLFHSSCTLLPNSSISFSNPANKTPPLAFMGDHHHLPMADSVASAVYDPLFHLNLPPQPPLFRDLFQSLPGHAYTLPVSRGGSLFGGGDHIEETSGGGIYPDGDGAVPQFDNGILEFARDMACLGKRKRSGKVKKHFATERERREKFNDKYNALRNLIPNPTKNDRASVVGDTINYIKELLRTVNELKLLVEKRRISRGRNKGQKTEQDSTADAAEMKPFGNDLDQSCNNGPLRSSWLQRKSKDTEVDVRIIDDEVTIKLVQRKKINCLLWVSKVLDELQLDLHHVAGGHIGEHCSFLFNTKIYEGSSVYASAIANKLIEVVDRQYASTPPTCCY